MAVAAYTARAGRTAFLSGAIDGPAKGDRTLIRAVFEYPFVTLNVKRLFAYVTESNYKSLEFCRRAGFSELSVIPEAGVDGEKIFLLELKPENCKFLRRHQ